jgi:2-aminoadipate transaminase
MITHDRFLARTGETLVHSAIRQMGTIAAQLPDVISFAPGYPAPETFPWAEYRDIAAELLSGRDGSYGPLLESLQALLAGRGVSTGLDQLMVTTGSQQGLTLVARLLIDPGDVILVELPTYTGAIAAFRNAQATLVGVRQEEDGIEIAHLDEVYLQQVAGGRRVKFLYVVPNFQNPTGLLIGLDKRRRLLEWAEGRDVLIVEDDPYGDLYFEDSARPEDTRPIKADDDEGRVVYLSSFSKTLAPAFRVAWIAAPAALVSKFDTAKQSADLCTSNLDQRIAYEACRRGVLERQWPRLRRHYQDKRSVMTTALSRALGDLVSWPHPRGGFFLWASLPLEIDTERMLARATKQRIIYVAGRAFFVDGGGAHLMRLSFSLPTAERIEEGVKRLATVIRAELAATPTAGVRATR